MKIAFATAASWFQRQKYIKQAFSESLAYLLLLTPGLEACNQVVNKIMTEGIADFPLVVTSGHEYPEWTNTYLYSNNCKKNKTNIRKTKQNNNKSKPPNKHLLPSFTWWFQLLTCPIHQQLVSTITVPEVLSSCSSASWWNSVSQKSSLLVLKLVTAALDTDSVLYHNV